LRDLDGVHKYETLLNMSNMTSGETAMRFARAAKELDPNRREAFALEASVLLDEGRAEESLAVIDEMDKISTPAFPQWTHRAEYYGWKATKLRAWALRMSGKAKEAHELEMGALKQSQPPVISLLHATRGRPIAAVQAMSLLLSRSARACRAHLRCRCGRRDCRAPATVRRCLSKQKWLLRRRMESGRTTLDRRHPAPTLRRLGATARVGHDDRIEA